MSLSRSNVLSEGLVRGLGIVVCAVLALGGCDTWFGKGDKPPLPGERISILAHQRNLVPDSRAQAEPVVLPAPRINPSNSAGRSSSRR